MFFLVYPMLKDNFGIKIHTEYHLILVMQQTETPFLLTHPDIFQLLKDVIYGFHEQSSKTTSCVKEMYVVLYQNILYDVKSKVRDDFCGVRMGIFVRVF